MQPDSSGMKRVSLKDIAQKAKVSVASVSYVLNGQENRVGEDVARRVKELAKKLNYRPNYLARSLKTRKTSTIGLVVADIRYRFTTGITRSIEAEAQKNKYSVLIGSFGEDPNRFMELVNVLIDREVDGLILLPVDGVEDEIRRLNKLHIPYVLMDRYFPEIPSNLIALDNYKAARNYVDYLVSLGHTHIGWINYSTSMHHLKERTRGYTDAVKKHKIPHGAGWNKKIKRKSLEADLHMAIDELLAEPHEKMAIIFATDTLAIQGLKYLNSLKKKIPQELSVLSFDESEAFQLFNCAITHGRQPLEEMGKLAVQTLLERINNKKILRQVMMESDFVHGESCGERLGRNGRKH